MFRNRVALLLFVLPSALFAPGDTIHLKNGTSLQVEKVQEKAGQVEYVVGGTTYSIPKSWVENIDASGSSRMRVTVEVPSSSFKVPAEAAAANASAERAAKRRESMPVLPPPAPAEEAEGKSALLQRILNSEGLVDPQALSAIEQEGIPHKSATAYFEAGRFELQHGQVDAACTFLEHAVSLWPEKPVLLEWYVDSLLRAGKVAAAVENAERVSQLAPESAGAFQLLGMAYYYSEKITAAIRAWKRSLEISPDPNLKKYLERAEREATAEADFDQQGSSHFNLRFDGGQTTPELQRQILETLEKQYAELMQQFNYAPPGSVSVILYTRQAFFDITQAPSWAGALNDGKLRIPLEGVTVMNPRLERALKHELTHSFLNGMSNQRCPGWLHEGLAQFMEPRDPVRIGPALAKMFKEERQIPINLLEQHFSGFSDIQATVAYAESLTIVDYLLHEYGMKDVQNILKRIAAGAKPEEAVRAVTHSNYTQLEAEINAYLHKNYSD